MVDEKMGARHTAPIVEVLKRGLKILSKHLPREEKRLNSGRSTTIWLISLRSSEVRGLQTTMGSCPILLPECWTSFQLQDIISMLRAHGCIVS